MARMGELAGVLDWEGVLKHTRLWEDEMCAAFAAVKKLMQQDTMWVFNEKGGLVLRELIILTHCHMF